MHHETVSAIIILLLEKPDFVIHMIDNLFCKISALQGPPKTCQLHG